MAAAVRSGSALRKAVRQRRRGRWLSLVVLAVNTVLFTALVARFADGLFVAALCATSLALLAGLVTLSSRFELRALRSDVTRPPVTRAQAQRFALGGLIVGAVAVLIALLVGAITDAWLTTIGIAAPFALMSAIWAFAVMRVARRDGPGS